MAFQSRKNKPPVRSPKGQVEEQSLAFRRSRTLTGSASSQVSSASESRSQLKSPRLKEHELKKHRKLLFGGFLGTLLLSGGCVWLLDQYVVSIDNLTNSQASSASYQPREYVTTIDKYLSARPLERFRFYLKPELLQQYISAQHPEVSSIQLSGSDGLVSTKGVIEFRQPIAVWQVGSTKYYVDQSGETFKKNHFADPAVSVRDESGIDVQTSQLVASSRLLRFLGQTVAGLNESGIGRVSQVTIPGGTLRQLDIKLDNHPYRIKTHMDREPVGQVADIVSTIKYLDSKSVAPEYVDNRVSGKAYYR